MTELAALRTRHSASFAEANGRVRTVSSVAPLHYEDNGEYKPVDFTLRNVNGVYVATGNEFHVGIEPDTGFMRMAPRGGSHSIDMKLVNVGWLAPASKTWTAIGSEPDYANLQKAHDVQRAAIGGEQRTLGAQAAWLNVFGAQYPVHVGLRVNADKFKIGVRMSRAALTYLVQQIPQAARSTAWIGLRYELRLSNIAGAKAGGQALDLADANEDGIIELFDSVGQSVAFLDADIIYDEATREDMPPRLQMRRRIYQNNGRTFLISGFPVSELSQFSTAEWVVFDPTITSTTTDPDDGTDRDTFFDAGFCQNGTSIRALIRFQNVTVPNGATISDAHIDFYQQFFYGAGTWNVIVKEADNHPGWSDTERYYAGLSWHATGGTTFSWTSNVDGLFTADATDPVQYVVNRPGWASGNAMGFSIDRYSGGTGRIWDVDDNPSLAAILSVTYSAGTTYERVVAVTETSAVSAVVSVVKQRNVAITETSAVLVVYSSTTTVTRTTSITETSAVIASITRTRQRSVAPTETSAVLVTTGSATVKARALSVDEASIIIVDANRLRFRATASSETNAVSAAVSVETELRRTVAPSETNAVSVLVAVTYDRAVSVAETSAVSVVTGRTRVRVATVSEAAVVDVSRNRTLPRAWTTTSTNSVAAIIGYAHREYVLRSRFLTPYRSSMTHTAPYAVTTNYRTRYRVAVTHRALYGGGTVKEYELGEIAYLEFTFVADGANETPPNVTFSVLKPDGTEVSYVPADAQVTLQTTGVYQFTPTCDMQGEWRVRVHDADWGLVHVERFRVLPKYGS